MHKIARFTIRILDRLVSYMAGVLLLSVIAYGAYGLWDSAQVYAMADASKFTQYRPDDGNSLSFEELRAINPDVFGWITIDGTSIDYPLLQGRSNDDYINTDVFGNFTLSGSIFLDAKADKSFNDFLSIIYGHHMERDKMFGNVDLFAEKSFFDTHKTGTLYFDDKSHKLQIFAYVECDAYDMSIYGNHEEENKRTEFIEKIAKSAMNYRDLGLTKDDHIVLLSTCDYSYTNGRMILLAKIEDI
ncbi:MAG: class B sortase [Lachnospiraceae bacterium]|nr:class B sortase [Lachnospiraceae bacterium]